MRKSTLFMSVVILAAISQCALAAGPFRNRLKRPCAAYCGKGDADPYSRAYASASTRAAKGIKGHITELEMPAVMKAGVCYQSGVGFSSSDPNPVTCLGVPGKTTATCAVVKGTDGWYATCVRP